MWVVFEWGLIALTVVLAAFTLVPLYHWRLGALRGPAFFRLQLFWIAIGVAALAIFVPSGGWISAVCIIISLVQALYIIKFTPLWRRQSVRADADLQADTQRHISILTANVKKSNRDYDALIGVIKTQQPDVVLAIEVDAKWIDALQSKLAEEYAHWVNVPRDTGYGMAVISRLGLTDTEVREVVTEGVPSVRTAVTLRSGAQVRLYVIHPEPPVFSHDTTGRDSEIAHIGMEAAQDDLPCVVTGDLNDVAWSRTTRRFQQLSGLLDPRVGRGFYNTFSAYYWWARWPLDHLFHDPRFRLLGITRMPKIGSDHFPMLFKIALADLPSEKAEVGTAGAAQRAEARDMINQEQARDRDAIGTDWEDEV